MFTIYGETGSERLSSLNPGAFKFLKPSMLKIHIIYSQFKCSVSLESGQYLSNVVISFTTQHLCSTIPIFVSVSKCILSPCFNDNPEKEQDWYYYPFVLLIFSRKELKQRITLSMIWGKIFVGEIKPVTLG